MEKIDELIAAYGTNYKSALKECEKRIQKKPKDPSFVVWKAAILLELGRIPEFTQLLEKICNWQPPVTDLKILDTVYGLDYYRSQVLGDPSITASPEIGTLFDNAANAGGKQFSKAVYDLLFHAAAFHGRWGDAQRAMLKLRRMEPESSKWFYGYIAATQLSAEKDSDESKSRLNKAVACKALSQAVTKSSTAPGLAGTLSTLRELRLLTEVYRRQGLHEQLLAVLDDPNVGIGSPIVKHSWEFVRVKLQTLKAEKLWKPLWDYCSHIITGALREDSASATVPYDFFAANWLVWECLLAATSGLRGEDARISERTESLITQYRDSSTSRMRLALLAMATKASTDDNSSQLLEACKAYFKSFGHVSSCFDDLRLLLQNLSSSDQRTFQDFASQAAREAGQPAEDESSFKKWSMIELNVLRFDYHFSISRAKEPGKDRLEAFACNCLRLSKLCGASNIEGTVGACLLAVMALVRLAHSFFKASDSSLERYAIQAVALLQWQLETHNDTYVSLLFVRLLVYFGLNTMALNAYEGLAIKEFLHDTLGHVLLTRISSNHPFATNSLSADWDPDDTLQQVLRFYSSSQEKLNKFFGESLEHEECEKLMELDELRTRLSLSFQRFSANIERQRIARLKGEPFINDSSHEYSRIKRDLLENKPVDLRDNRDFNTFPNFECSTGPRFDQYIQNGPKPGKFWLVSCFFAEEVYAVISRKQLRCRLDPSVILDAAESQKAELTPAEQEASVGWALLAPIAMKALVEETTGQGKAKEIAESINTDLQKLESWLTDLRESYASGQYSAPHGLLPVCHELQPMFIHLDVLLACWKLCDGLLQCAKQKSYKLKGKIPKEQVLRMMDVIQDSHARIRKRAADWQNSLGLSAIADRVLEGATGEAIEQLLGEGTTVFAEGGAGLMVDAALDTLDGVLAVRLPKGQA